MAKILLKTDRHLLYIIKRENKEFIRFNLKTKTMEKRYRNQGDWVPVSYQYGFFKGLTVRDIEADEKFIKMIELVKQENSNCRSLSTFFNRLSEVMVYETYITEGIRFEIKKRWNYRGYEPQHLTHQANDYDKHTRAILRESQYTVDADFEKMYFGEDKQLVMKVIDALRFVDARADDKRSVLRVLVNSSYKMKRLVNQFKYEPKALLRFCIEYLKPFENLQIDESLGLLDDYFNMASEVGRSVKKYPKYLKSMHDIIRANFDAAKREYDEKRFAELQLPELEFKDKDYCIVLPKSSKDIVAEGVDLNHCVSSYVDKILEGRTMIIFLRKSDKPQESLVTLEFQNNKIVQARGSYNRKLDEQEKEFLKKFCEKKKIELAVEASIL
jgi:hypothetical protein